MIFLDILYILILLIYIPLNPRFLFRKEYRKIMKGRFSPDTSCSEKKRIWIHAVSVGEVKSLKSFISLLQARTDHPVILSVTTPSGFKIAKEIYRDLEVVNGPFDLSFTVRKFIRKINPSIIVLNELEIWPNWISMTEKMGIPVAVINGRISQKAFKSYNKFSFLLKRFFRKIDLYLLQEEHYAEKFRALGATPDSIKISGNIKADEAVAASGKVRSSEEIYDLLGIDKPAKRTLLFASTHTADENIFIPILPDLLKKYVVIIAPRHMDRIREISEALKENRLSFRIWSEGKPSVGDIIIFNKMGYLTELIRISNIVFMGGTFDTATGGHNLYEPAVLGKKIIGGPHYNNFLSIGEALVKNGVYSTVKSSEQLQSVLMNITDKEISDSARPAEETVIKRSGAIEFSIREVMKLIN